MQWCTIYLYELLGTDLSQPLYTTDIHRHRIAVGMCTQAWDASGPGRILPERRLARPEAQSESERSRSPRSRTSALNYEAAQHRARRRWAAHALPILEPDADPGDVHRDDDDMGAEDPPSDADAQSDLLQVQQVPGDRPARWMRLRAHLATLPSAT
eukprot:7839113-Pyramimonas_sp.AAC.1